MIKKAIEKWTCLFNKMSYELKILGVFRFISFFFTSTFYILVNTEHEIERKIIIIGCLFISSIILFYLYPIYEKSKISIKLLLIIEIIGNILLLVPSGGLKSPFIWYSLNTILISVVFLKGIYAWLNFIIYLLCYGIIMNYFTNNINITYIISESNLILSFIMIIASLQVLANSIKKIKEKSIRLEVANTQLENANKLIIESIDHIKELYNSVNILANQGNIDGIINVSFEHIKRITKAKSVFYYDLINNKIIYSNDNHLNCIEEYILNNIDELIEFNEPLNVNIERSNILLVRVFSSFNLYGLIGMEVSEDEINNAVNKNNSYQLLFLSELMAGAFERLTLEEVNERLLITEEQNRIANEIHDSVLQRLFSLSWGIFSLLKNINKHTKEEISNELDNYRVIIDTTMKELRNKIYGLSWKKSGNSSFILDIKKYIDDIKRFNHVNIPLSIQGNIENLSTEQKKALYRIMCESIGNAVRHGKAKNIDVKLIIKSNNTELSVIDDGVGFDSNIDLDKFEGLGLKNLHQLTEVMQGNILISSKINKGTKIEINLPSLMMKGEAAI